MHTGSKQADKGSVGEDEAVFVDGETLYLLHQDANAKDDPVRRLTSLISNQMVSSFAKGYSVCDFKFRRESRSEDVDLVVDLVEDEYRGSPISVAYCRMSQKLTFTVD